MNELLKTGDALQFNWLSQLTVNPQSIARNANIEVVLQWPGTVNVLIRQFGDGTIRLALKVQTLSRNLLKMNLHLPNLSEFIGRIYS